MNKTAIKNFAVWARRKLISDITNKARMLGVDENGIAEKLSQSTDDLHFFDVGTKNYAEVAGNEIIQREALVKAIKSKEHSFKNYKDAFENIVEEAAYTWFNRLVAIRFMEVNDYLPSGVRVLSSINKAKNEPDFVTSPFDTDLEFTPYEQDRVIQLKDENKLDELFRMLFIKQCNKLHDILPELFENTDDYTELLLTISFTDKDGIVYRLVHDIEEDDFNVEKEGQVEIIGWMYQYYNIEPKDKVFSRPSGQKIRKEDIPAATQLFTPDWIVRYMVENSLGRIVIHNLKYADWSESEKTKINDFKSKWKYYLEEAEQTPEIVERFRIEESHKYCKGDLPPFVDTTFLDPCMGSGHILVYAFDVFMDIYRMQGYTDREAVRSILENNLYGLEIDDRATQLAYFSIMMKARSYDRRFLARKDENGKPDIPKLNICSIQESNLINPEYIELFGELKPIAQKLLDEFIDAKEYGSILNLSITEDEIFQLEEKYAEIDNTVYDNFFDTAKQSGLRTVFTPLLKQAKIMVEKYDVVCTNPPYMGGSGMDKDLSTYVKNNYPDSKADLFAVFIEKGNSWIVANGYNSMVTMQSWMFLSSFEKMRLNILGTKTITNLMHMENMVMGIAFGTAVTVFKNSQVPYYKGTYNLVTLKDIENSKPKVFPNYENRFAQVSTENFSKIPGSPIAYWVSENFIKTFDNQRIYDIGNAKQGIIPGNVNEFVRLWYEVKLEKIGFNHIEYRDINKYHHKWFPYNKGGSFRRWYGNIEYIVNMENNGYAIKYSGANNNYRLREPELYFKEAVTWSKISSGEFSARYMPKGNLFDIAGCCIFNLNDNLYYSLGELNTKVIAHMLKVISPTLNYEVEHIKCLPIKNDTINKDLVNSLVEKNISMSKTDWDSFETSWDFKRHPLVAMKLAGAYAWGDDKPTMRLPSAYNAWKILCEGRFNKLKANEEELNRIFIEIYGLQDELTPDVADKDITVHRVFDSKDDVPESMKGSNYIRTKRDEIISLIFYAVGCMFGRYSLDKEGLIFAGGNFNDTFIEDALYPSDTLYPSDNLFPKEPEYSKLKTDDGEIDLSFYPDYDNCIPITDEAYFEDDIVGRFEEFVKVVYGEQTLEENLDFIAKALGNKGVTSRDVIRNYFLNDFFKDHCKIYQKRPIYWLFDSGKNNGFKALCYMHRWNADTIGNMRVEYLHRIQRVYEKELERMQEIIDNSRDNKEISNATKRKEKLQKQIKETKDYDAKVAHLALSRIDIDLDDGVKVNYEKVQTGQDGKKLQILAKI
ncbi:MAG: BREX-1 system adenine-specific DNA-methyltransferase PglX [Ruminococcus sp.]